MKPDDVTSDMLYQLWTAADLGQDGESTPKEIIAAAWNAVVSDAEPITAEWLVANGWKEGKLLYSLDICEELRLCWDGETIAIRKACLTFVLPTKTIGQLRALHAGLGIGEVQS